MSDPLSRVEAVMEAMTYCDCWNYPFKTLELTHKEFRELLMEKNDMRNAMGPLVRSSTYIRVWGVDVRAESYPKRSVIRARYLQIINPSPWIDQLAEDMEKYR